MSDVSELVESKRNPIDNGFRELVESKRNPIDNGFRELVRIYFK